MKGTSGRSFSPAQAPPKKERPAYEEDFSRLKANPQFHFVEPSGAGLILGGQSPKHPKPQN
jgi:hypothetical protein